MVSTEPWNFFQNEYSQEYKYLIKIHEKIKVYLNNTIKT